jgi:alpha-1,2-mannosyltransferase
LISSWIPRHFILYFSNLGTWLKALHGRVLLSSARALVPCFLRRTPCSNLSLIFSSVSRISFLPHHGDLTMYLYQDTMGYAFTLPFVSIVACIPVGAYIHYPTISTDMLTRVRSRKPWHTNSDSISSSYILSFGKIMPVYLIRLINVYRLTRCCTFRYYHLVMYYYAHSLRRASFLMVNSSWTKNHIDSILSRSNLLLDVIHFPLSIWLRPFVASSKNPARTTQVVYPPCDTRKMSEFPLDHRGRIILSVAQFR